LVIERQATIRLPYFLRIKMEETTNPKKNKRKFKQTKQLVRLALNGGWTQSEIALACRTQQSVVSAWKKGSTSGTEESLKPLLDVYGHKLRRNSFRVYWSVDSATNEKAFHKVEGKVVLSQAFFDARRDSAKLVKRIPKYKLIVHHQGSNKFRLVFQSRLTFSHSNEELESSIEDAIWGSAISEQFELSELLKVVDSYAQKTLGDYPSDANTLPFIARQALLNHGFDIDGVVEYPAVW
jgi:transcriptional regulator with XRE-family HTH domain